MAIKGPGYTVNDLIFYTGLFSGVIVVYLALAPYDIHRLLRLLAGGAVGLVLGWTLERAYRSAASRPPETSMEDRPPEDQDQQRW